MDRIGRRPGFRRIDEPHHVMRGDIDRVFDVELVIILRFEIGPSQASHFHRCSRTQAIVLASRISIT